MKCFTGCMLSLSVVVWTYGCSGGEGDFTGVSGEPTLGESDSAQMIEETTIAEISTGRETVAFLQWGEGQDAVLLLKVSGSASDGGNVLDALQADAGELTLLEIFRALAPDEAPPRLLVEAHAFEATALDRQNDEIRVVDKFLHNAQPPFGACHEATVFPGPISWFSKQAMWSQSGRRHLCAGSPQQSGGQMLSSSCTHYTTSRQRVVACVPAGSGGSAVTQAGFGNLGGNWSITSGVDNVAPGQYSLWEFPPNMNIQRRLAIESLGGSSYTLQSAYGF